MSTTRSDRYTSVAIALHWLVAALVVGQIAWGWWMQDIPKQPVGPRVDAFNLHKSVGLTVLGLMLVRLGWRLGHPPPPLPPLPPWQARLAASTHALLYVLLVLLPVVGYLGSVFSGYPVKFYGIALPAWGWKDSGLKDLCATIHLWGSYALVALSAVHVAAALKHALVEGDGLLVRMGVGRRRG